MGKNQEYACVYDWDDGSGRGDHVGAAASPLVGRREGADYAGDLHAGNVGIAGRPSARDSAQPALHLRRFYASGALSAVGAGEEVVPASEYRALQQQVRELQRLLGKRTLETEILREALDIAQPKKRLLRSPSSGQDGTP